MKKVLSLALVCTLLACMLTGCGSSGGSQANPTAEPTQQAGSFAPETTAVATSGLAQVLASVSDDEGADEELEMAQKALTDMIGITETAVPQQAAEDIPAATDAPVQDEPVEDIPAEDAPVVEITAAPVPEVTPEPVVTANPAEVFATATPQPNTAITGYSQISNTGLGFQFSYPTGWQNIPGRSTVCFVQPTTDGTVYPARVSVSMKQLSHKGNDERLEEQMVEFVKTIMSQYDEKTFEVEEKLDNSNTFMGNRKTLATTYLAYDGDQEIAGYYIMTYFEKYVFCFHFVCAYEDYEAFSTAMRHMRDSVAAEAMPTAAE
ncbi:MAG: hypothetical protein IJ466_01815 [Clostridia bacterium]|nr:hypothetical protein [Clostridia bacterium]